MSGKLINLNEYWISNKIFTKKLVNYNDDSFVSYQKDECPNLEDKSSISNDKLISFIVDFGVKVQENDSKFYTILMRKYHKCILFYGVKYYVPSHKLDEEKQNIFDFLIKNYLVD